MRGEFRYMWKTTCDNSKRVKIIQSKSIPTRKCFALVRAVNVNVKRQVFECDYIFDGIDVAR